MGNNWIEFIKQYSKANGMSFKDAMSSASCKDKWKSSKTGAGLSSSKSKVAVIDQFNAEQQEIIRRHNEIKRIATEKALKKKAMDEADRKADMELEKEHKMRLKRYKKE